MSFKDLFSGHASTYAKYRPEYPEPLYDYLATLVPVHELAWDCGTGNGQAAHALAGKFKKVIATDASQKQIESAVPHPKVEYRVAPAENSGLPPACVDLVTVAQALHWFEFEKFYAEVSRVLKPDGRLAVWCYGTSRISAEIDRVVDEVYDGILGKYWDPARLYIDENYRTIPFLMEEIKPTPEFSLVCEWTADQYLGYIESWSALQNYRKQHGSATRDSRSAEIDPAPGNEPDLIKSLAQKLAPIWKDKKKVIWPMAVRIGKKTRP